MDYQHTSVLLEAAVNALVTDRQGIYVDCTLGGAGHGYSITGMLEPNGWYVGIDQDPAAIRNAEVKLAHRSCRISIVNANFAELKRILTDLNIQAVHGVLFDLGVSSHQLDIAERGFSYMGDGPLDMRMDPGLEFSASDVVNDYPEQRLAQVIFEYGEERWAKRIAKFIVSERKKQPIMTTGRLVDIIKQAIPAPVRREGPHPAKRTFQAIRIEVNRELEILEEALLAAVDSLQSGGRICVITFHSLEDRIVKKTFRDLTKSCTCPPDFPICVCGAKPKLKLAGKPITPSPEELEFNPRSRSATLRVAEKL